MYTGYRKRQRPHNEKENTKMENRISNIKNNLTAFENTAYTKKDVLTELLKLQDQMGNGLPELKARKSKPRINDIFNHFKEWNANLKNVAETELCEFEKLSAQFGNRVSAEISGDRKAHV
jgi:septal ring factor EnvC (AmiA/AmiB activator)